MPGFLRILIAVDGSELGNHVLKTGLGLAKRLGSAVTILHVVDAGPYAALPSNLDLGALRDAMVRSGADVLKGAADAARTAGVEHTTRVAEGLPAQVILDAAKHADLVVLGTHGRTGIEHFLLGSVAEKVIRLAPVPVLVVRNPGETR